MPFRFLKNLNLNFKLNAVLLVAFGILALALVVARDVTFKTLFHGMGEQQLTQDAETLQQHFNDTVAEILNSARSVSYTHLTLPTN